MFIATMIWLEISLSNFTVSIDDTRGKIDMVKRVLDLSHASNGFAPKLFASVWSAVSLTIDLIGVLKLTI